MKTNLTEAKFKSRIGLTRCVLTELLCLAVTCLICTRAPAQNLFAVGVDPTTGGFTGSIDEFTPNGVRSTFGSGLTAPFALAFDGAGNLFVTDWGNGNGGHIYKFAPTGVRNTFAELGAPEGVAFDSAGNLFVVDEDTGNIFKFTPEGVRSTFAKPFGLVLDEVAHLGFWPPSTRAGPPPTSAAVTRATVADFNGDGNRTMSFTMPRRVRQRSGI
jgi:hypothetical protein